MLRRTTALNQLTDSLREKTDVGRRPYGRQIVLTLADQATVSARSFATLNFTTVFAGTSIMAPVEGLRA